MVYKRDGIPYTSYQEYQVICKIDKEAKNKNKSKSKSMHSLHRIKKLSNKKG